MPSRCGAKSMRLCAVLASLVGKLLLLTTTSPVPAGAAARTQPGWKSAWVFTPCDLGAAWVPAERYALRGHRPGGSQSLAVTVAGW